MKLPQISLERLLAFNVATPNSIHRMTHLPARFHALSPGGIDEAHTMRLNLVS
ncbi:hypothetical protein BDR07DRAFT_1421057 [Suillus spraguei]|nr:hypothetical protein BDR07DRAFT_1434487 [Suillus spraguei]KAG2357220.1 hypothetical protein BDR07DRAFT_1421057 [Suillus spraguei]